MCYNNKAGLTAYKYRILKTAGKVYPYKSRRGIASDELS